MITVLVSKLSTGTALGTGTVVFEIALILF